MTTFNLSSKLIVYPGAAAWRFLVIPPNKGKEIKDRFGKHASAWGSLRVTVRIGKTRWKTSLFPDKKAGTYLLPVKASVRTKEAVEDGTDIAFSISF